MNGPWKLLEGSVIEVRYHLEKLLGAGGYGAVFRASEVVRDRVIRQLAAKLIEVRDSDRQLQELETALNVQHPNLIRCFSGGETALQNQQFFFLLMELAEYNLEQLLQQGTLTSEATKKLLQDTTAGLSYLHDSKRVHRDLAPGNLLWVEGHWKIGDFGLTRQMDNTSRGITSNAAGRLGFAPPESYQGIYSPASDIWSLGIVTVYALTKQLPFNFQTDEELHRCVMDYNLTLPQLPDPLMEIVQGCLQSKPQTRWTADQVKAFLNSPPVPSPNTTDCLTPAPSAPTEFSRRTMLLTLLGSVFAGASGWEYLRPKSLSIPSYTEPLGQGVLLNMVAIPAGRFLMGSPNGEGEEDERPQHRVTVPGFYMSMYTVTNAQWKAVMGASPTSKPDQEVHGDNQPVINVSWNDAQAFCQKLEQISGKPYRLPSEAEWEYACRAGTQTQYPSGDDENQLGKYAWYRGSSNLQIHPVGQKKPNAFGLYDMLGNVWEWCQDYGHNSYQGAPIDGSAWETDPDRYSSRVLRGGFWSSPPGNCRSACRNSLNAKYVGTAIGFRVVNVIPGT